VLGFIRILCHDVFSTDKLNFLEAEEKRLRGLADKLLPISEKTLNWHWLLYHVRPQIWKWGSLKRAWLYACERLNGWVRALIYSRVEPDENVLNTVFALVAIVYCVDEKV